MGFREGVIGLKKKLVLLNILGVEINGESQTQYVTVNNVELILINV